MTTRFNNAISKLVKAFFEGCLKKGDCSACAVGNICNGRAGWQNVFMTSDEEQNFCISAYRGFAKEVIDQTGYSPYELARVEKAFETNAKIRHDYYLKHSKKEIIEDQFNGLMAVVDVLCDIEGFNDETVEKTKQLFHAANY